MSKTLDGDAMLDRMGEVVMTRKLTDVELVVLALTRAGDGGITLSKLRDTTQRLNAVRRHLALKALRDAGRIELVGVDSGRRPALLVRLITGREAA